MIARITLYIVASWFIAAHFLREDNLILTALCLLTPVLFIIRRRWSLLVLQYLAYASAAIWLDTAWEIVVARQLSGEPWLRAAIILIVVAAICLIAGILLRNRGLQERYCLR